ncbi:uncharacterized protein L969DRAFT_93493 [Mixia osmundae IAM 14324]|uniref:Serine hydrolase domain-containing protein n=1 Tax=Mixia osmundae (strain CBS 9802 / IAM 14324 / JCM 22182 / KY 12970) TaxID=764103 RepID=G7DU48_MIXOS|nr:uncharacterized protein L969DRAFT_93493 [Mixia osmundae IAM 14324]KEI40974.1 hypothetical protein L969DRAFT_93493 [Mixia osmundae IAM 14324]GAA94108.1 hypothetical protein E5Q_00755 [Mixia osmundae IAM 14324]
MRILCLHGYLQNGAIVSRKWGALRRELAGFAELDFVDAPHIIAKPDSSTDLSSFGAEDVGSSDDDPSSVPRSWWDARDGPSGRREIHGYTESLAYLHPMLIKNKYDAVIGFSQGAAMAALLTVLLHRPELEVSFAQGERIPPFKASIFISGFKAAYYHQEPYWTSVLTGAPTLNILGKNDWIVTADRSQPLIDAFEASRVEYHEGSHFLPLKASWKRFVHQWLKAIQAGEPSDSVPGPSGSSQAASREASVPLEGGKL